MLTGKSQTQTISLKKRWWPWGPHGGTKMAERRFCSDSVMPQHRGHVAVIHHWQSGGGLDAKRKIVCGAKSLRALRSALAPHRGASTGTRARGHGEVTTSTDQANAQHWESSKGWVGNHSQCCRSLPEWTGAKHQEEERILHLYQIWGSEHENIREQVLLLNPDSAFKKKKKKLILFTDGST